jgi:hypothetical protein
MKKIPTAKHSPLIIGGVEIATAAARKAAALDNDAIHGAFIGLSDALRAAGCDPDRHFLEVSDYALFGRDANTPEEHKEVAARIIQEAQP